MTIVATQCWVRVCADDRLLVEQGVAAMVGGVQIAVFRTFDDRLYAVSNIDPFTGAGVMSRGIVGTREGRDTVASPLYKQVFDLASGRCLDDDSVALTTYAIRVIDGELEVRSG